MTERSADELLRLEGITKHFGGVRALQSVDLHVNQAEVHALIGENGAGKSTLMKILSGALSADEGTVHLQDKQVSISSPAVGRKLGVAMIYQELNLAPHLTVEENLMLGVETSRFGFLTRDRERVQHALDILGHGDLPLSTKVGSLSVSVQQVLEIARALVSEAKVVVMDEPTSSLSSEDTHALFNVIRRLKNSGIAVIYISHYLEEIKEIADRYTVLRDGKSVHTGIVHDSPIEEIVTHMIGRELGELFPKSDVEPGELLLEVDQISGHALPQLASLKLHRGEILGIAGLVGAGRSELIRSIFGLHPVKTGTYTLRDESTKPVKSMSPTRARRLGLDLLSEDRKNEGLAVSMSIADNVTLPTLARYTSAGGWGLLKLQKERASVAKWIERLNIKSRSADQAIDTLSGGNQQKVAFARILEQDADVILLDEPTRGVDIGSKVEIFELINRLKEANKGIIFVSSYLPELMGMCDTLAVMHRGRLSAIRPIDEWTEHDVMLTATSGKEIGIAQ